MDRSLGICEKLSNQKAPMAEQCVAIEMPEVISRRVTAVSRELYPRTFALRSVRARSPTGGKLSGSEYQSARFGTSQFLAKARGRHERFSGIEVNGGRLRYSSRAHSLPLWR